ncbi:hypothetical protein [Rhizobium leguminosarum]|uniref:hypothetical protein n=1 Tax=Rhizobium leguminosarum TaxID=384 RepID=UPI003F98FFE9
MKISDLSGGTVFEDEFAPEEDKLFRLFKGLPAGESVPMTEMISAFERVEDLEAAQAGLARRVFIKLISMPNFPGRTNKVMPAILTLEGERKLKEIYPVPS